ncbi:hypothetical protein FN846DRAFT_474368 [Sphaerosporella brunnea]|uniref:DUF221-domain-containing protein n=1 Tax=Sphaerosporella brunnea TaxID=1250544 RepID=A0A5J5EFW6_9PEZI|nr:hypothetical protein FN846DRAFT_474368 [Sphaerosporella brunnea]
MDAAFHHLLRRQNIANANNDKNIGSARNTTTSAFVSTLIVNLIIFGVFALIFIVLRRSNRRIYAPRTYVGAVEKWRRLRILDDNGDGYADEVEGVSGFSGLVGWVKGVWSIPDETVLRTNGLDGYFFLRYLRKAQLLCFVGCVITWPILFPVNATGGGGQQGLDMLSQSNIAQTSQNTKRLYAHVFLGWIFYGFVLFTVYRELIFYTTTKQAYMLSPIYSTRISARTLLIQTVPMQYMNETALRRTFEHVKRVWITADTTELDKLVEERDEIAMKLEAAEVALIKMADKARAKQGGEAPKDNSEDVDAESGSVAAAWVPRDKRPTHKLKFLVGEKVDTIDWCRTKLGELNPKIAEMQESYRNGEAKKLSSVFIEFNTQSAAQVALQTLAHQKPLHMAPRYIGLTPEEIIWSNMKLLWWERLVKFAITTAFVVALVIFWSIPVAVVGAISQINYLTEQLPWLGFINKIPEVVLGVITGLLPSVMLAVLMALLPIVLRLMAKISGLPSASLIELRVQNSYFLFQVVQVFLVTTMTSAASAAVPRIAKDPSLVISLLSSSIPKASNFYIAFMILQGLALSSGALVQLAGFVLYKVLGMLLDNTPRKMYNRWSSLSGLGWGTVFPVYTNMCVIALTYALIAPLVMGFATVGLGLLYFAYRYNFLFVYNVNINTNGMVYPRALYQTLTGVYLGEICLIGLFAIRKEPGPVVLQVMFLIFTILFHITLDNAVAPLLKFLPKNLQVEEEALLSLENGHPEPKNTTISERPVIAEGSDGKNMPSAVDADGDGHADIPLDPDGDGELGIAETKPGMIARFLHPERYESYQHMRKRIPQDYPEIIYTPETERDAYFQPSITAKPIPLWIPRDAGGVSRQEVAHTSVHHPISDHGAIITDGKIERHEDAFPPGYTEKPLW